MTTEDHRWSGASRVLSFGEVGRDHQWTCVDSRAASAGPQKPPTTVVDAISPPSSSLSPARVGREDLRGLGCEWNREKGLPPRPSAAGPTSPVLPRVRAPRIRFPASQVHPVLARPPPSPPPALPKVVALAVRAATTPQLEAPREAAPAESQVPAPTAAPTRDAYEARLYVHELLARHARLRVLRQECGPPPVSRPDPTRRSPWSLSQDTLRWAGSSHPCLGPVISGGARTC